MKVVVSAEAEADLEAIGDFIARDNPGRAERLVRQLRACCLDLRLMPRKFRLVPRYERYGIRRRVHGNYLIFYRVEESRIAILHVLHGATDYAAIIFPEDDRSG